MEDHLLRLEVFYQYGNEQVETIVIHSWEITIRLRNRKDWENERKIINLNYFIWKKDIG